MLLSTIFHKNLKKFFIFLFSSGEKGNQEIPLYPPSRTETETSPNIQMKDPNLSFVIDEDLSFRPVFSKTAAGSFNFIPTRSSSTSSIDLPADTNCETNNQIDTLTRFFPSMKETKLEKVVKKYNTDVPNLVDQATKDIFSERETNEIRGIPQGAVLPPPLFPTVFGSSVFSPVLSRNPAMAPMTAGVFRYPFGLYARDFPVRFSTYLNQFPTPSIYLSGTPAYDNRLQLHPDLSTKMISKEESLQSHKEDTDK